ncbi:hypothetical protein PsYK624_112650 [Phanerochaete sordida]|uniref:Uncharacterized protein n=1 Tax=Phanerochaete sordida TaxID=48140 RepID=A0A9P3GK96_9APHY|nr:hypothetical protein PsYK624_112650 [Phanerochaete sordida]
MRTSAVASVLEFAGARRHASLYVFSPSFRVFAPEYQTFAKRKDDKLLIELYVHGTAGYMPLNFTITLLPHRLVIYTIFSPHSPAWSQLQPEPLQLAGLNQRDRESRACRFKLPNFNPWQPLR